MGTHHQISEEEQNRVASLQQENINNQMATKRVTNVPPPTIDRVMNTDTLKQENSPAGTPSEDEPKQQVSEFVANNV